MNSFVSALRIPTLIVFGLLTVAAPARGQMTSAGFAESLKGVREVVVVALFEANDAATTTLSRTVAQTIMELRLRQSGVPIIAADDLVPDTTQRIVLTGRVTVVPAPAPFAALMTYHVEVSAFQSVRISRLGDEPFSAITWNVQDLGFVGRDRLQEVRTILGDKVDGFANAYWSANPRR